MLHVKKSKKNSKARNILADQNEEQQKERSVFKLFLNFKHSQSQQLKQTTTGIS